MLAKLEQAATAESRSTELVLMFAGHSLAVAGARAALRLA
ncbi:hypothetical protein KTAU_01580 [Thermogemmatispora aurantia]|uniref:Uncharacterized protein n=1 Tax=Thermogemmatispora aurantia TaxID=2045279 RepID=A0A5J4K3Z6_9CHLR|nr:hypothetical protein KTAU_01580 [Thermogemmatispora aurantia]